MMQRDGRLPWTLIAVLFFSSLSACATYKPDYSSFLNQAKTRQVPILIYNTSWNDPRGGGRLAVWIANLQNKVIDSIELAVAPCGAKGSVGRVTPLILGGPFYGNMSYVSLPSWPIDAHYYPAAGTEYADLAISSGHMLIQAVTIRYANGEHVTYDDQIAQLLTKNITNYCTNVTFITPTLPFDS
jgi:hypothetical protein